MEHRPAHQNVLGTTPGQGHGGNQLLFLSHIALSPSEDKKKYNNENLKNNKCGYFKKDINLRPKGNMGLDEETLETPPEVNKKSGWHYFHLLSNIFNFSSEIS